jgi:hypothetical protein
MQEALATGQLVWSYAIRIVAAIAILIIGWFVSKLIAAVVRRGLHRTELDKKLVRWITGKETEEGIDTEGKISKGIFYLLMLFVLVAFFQVLGITLITEPLNRFLTVVLEYLPRVYAAGLLILAAWILASLLRLLIHRVLSATKLDQKFSTQADIEKKKVVPLSKTLSEIAYWLVFLLFLPAILNALALQGLLEPVNSLVTKVLAFLPNIFTSVLILVAGWFIARVVQRISTNLLAAIGTDNLGERVGINRVLGTQQPSAAIGIVLYVLVLIPVLIAALNALQLSALTEPASNMLNKILGMLPAIFAAIIVLITAYVIGRILSGLIHNLLSGVGFDNIMAKFGIGKELAKGERTPSEIVGFLVLVAIMIFAFMEAFGLLGFASLVDLISRFLVFTGHIVVGLIIFGIGLYLANLAANVIQASKAAQAGLLASAARVSVIVLATAVALRQMGLANEIINLAFALLIGAIAVAVAIAFGLGGREIASRKLGEWLESIGSSKSKKE